MKKRVSIPKDTKRRLLIECGFKCTMNRCDREIALEIHHIDENPENNDINNLIILCAIHHEMATRGILDKKTCQILKRTLNEVETLSGKNKELKSRDIFFKETKKELECSSKLRATFVGPTFIRPVFIINARNNTKSTIDLDSYFFEFIQQNETKIIFRNNSRYRDKILEYIKNEDELKQYQKEMLNLIETIETDDRFSKFKFCCIDSGFYKIDYIFDNSLITSSRKANDTPIIGGVLYKDKHEIERAKTNFDNLFENCYRGKAVEYKSLKEYINNLF